MTRDLQLKIRVDAEDKQRLEYLSKHFAIPAASVVRMLVKREADALGLKIEPKPAKKVAKKKTT